MQGILTVVQRRSLRMTRWTERKRYYPLIRRLRRHLPPRGKASYLVIAYFNNFLFVTRQSYYVHFRPLKSCGARRVKRTVRWTVRRNLGERFIIATCQGDTTDSVPVTFFRLGVHPVPDYRNGRFSALLDDCSLDVCPIRLRSHSSKIILKSAHCGASRFYGIKNLRVQGKRPTLYAIVLLGSLPMKSLIFVRKNNRYR